MNTEGLLAFAIGMHLALLFIIEHRLTKILEKMK